MSCHEPWTSERFCDAWFAGTLFRKAQHSSYYNQKFDNAEFLCYYVPSDTTVEHPYVIAMRCYKTGIVICDDRNASKVTPDGYVYERRYITDMGKYKTNFAEINRKAKDLAEIKAIDWEVKDTPTGKLLLVLFDINGYRFYTDLASNVCARSRSEFLNYDELNMVNQGTTLLLDLFPAPVHCEKIADARRMSLPSEREDIKVIDRHIFEPAPDFDPSIPSQTIRDVRWKPSEMGWSLPEDMVYDDGTLNYTWKSLRETEEKFYSKAKKYYKGDVSANIIKYANAWYKWKKAADFLTGRKIDGRSPLNCAFDFNSENALHDQNGIPFLKNTVVGKNQDDTSCSIDLGDEWHRVIERR